MKNSLLEVAGLYTNLAEIGRFVSQQADEAGLDDRGIYAVQMSVDEACSNIIAHAYGGEGKGDIELHCQKIDGGLKVTIQDTGRQFDPAMVGSPDLTAPLEERDSGGLGIFLMRQLMDEVTFEFSDKGNTLVMIKRVEK